MHKPLAECPVCSEALYIAELACESCGTRITGAFRSSALHRLDEERSELLVGFLRHRGDLDGLAEEMGVSLAEIAGRLDALLDVLGIVEQPDIAIEEPEPPRRHIDRDRILEELDRGEISAEEATRRLRELS